MNYLVRLTLAGLLALSLTARAEDAAPAPKHEGRPGAGRVMDLVPPMMVEKLELTAEQKAKLADLEKAYAAEREKLPAVSREDTMKMHEELAAARKAGDKAKAQELRKKIMEAYAPQMELRRKYMEQFRALLTDEQKKKLDEARPAAHGKGAPKGGEKPAEK